jgi:hypothetical protein
MTVTISRNLTFEPITCGWSMISRHIYWLEHSRRIDMSDMWFRYKLFPSNAWRQDQLLRLSEMLVAPEA